MNIKTNPMPKGSLKLKEVKGYIIINGNKYDVTDPSLETYIKIEQGFSNMENR